MATLEDLKVQIENANALGLANLEKYGIGVLGRPSITGTMPPTTYDIMDAISLIEQGGGNSGVEYTNIVYNNDDTVTLTDTDGVEHTMICTYADGKLNSVTYDEKNS